MKRILVAGSSNIDFVLRVKEMPKKGETIISRSFEKIPGGKGANQACACGKLGGNVSFLSCVGRDGLDDIVIESLKNANVDIQRIGLSETEPTGMAIISVNDEGENSIMLVPGANKLCDFEYFNKNKDYIENVDLVLAQLETPEQDIYRLLNEAKKLGKLTILNPAPAPDSIPDEALNGLDYFTPNETELEKLTGMPTNTIDEVCLAAQSMLDKGVRNVLVTIGPRGALLCSKNGSKHYETFDVKPVDTTAAGDTFNAAVAVGLVEGMGIDEAIEFANAAASISITRKGAQTSIPKRAEVNEFISANRMA